MNECCFYEWCLCEIDCVFSIFFFLCEVEARLRTPSNSMNYSRFLWLLLLLFWAFLAPMQNGYLYKAPSFCIYKKNPNIKSFISAHLVEFAQNLLIFSHIMTHSLIIQLSFSSVFILNCLVDSTPKISMICFILSIFDLFIIFLILFLGQSGGMDEELFTKSFEDVPKVQVGLSFLGK